MKKKQDKKRNETYLIFARQWTSFNMHIPCVGDQIRNFQRQEKNTFLYFFRLD